jgi:hypothetical protein
MEMQLLRTLEDHASEHYVCLMQAVWVIEESPCLTGVLLAGMGMKMLRTLIELASAAWVVELSPCLR